MLIFSNYGIEIHKRNDMYFIKYDAGQISIQYVEIEVPIEDAIKAMKSEQSAYEVIIDYQNRRTLGEDYLERYNS